MKTIIISMVFLFLVSNYLIAQVIDDFNSPNLDKKLWEMRKVGKASYEIKDGILIMSSPSIESGIILYHPRNIVDMDINFEIKINTAGLVDNIVCGSLAEIMDPQLNDNINNNLEASLFFTVDKCYVKQDPVVIGQKPPNPAGMESQYERSGWNIVQISFNRSKGKVTFIINGKIVGEVDINKDVKQRFFFITSDPYTSHYTGEAKIEYVKFSGQGALSLAVSKIDKLPVTWAKIKI
ncbi:MAG: hypothetical protein ACPL7B_08545 [Candidatus Poribacteria bacterium]